MWCSHEHHVESEADGIVQCCVLQEGMVGALVHDHPHAIECAALRRPIERPRRQVEHTACGERRDRHQRHVEERGDSEEVLLEVGRGPEHEAPEAVRRGGSPDVGARRRQASG